MRAAVGRAVGRLPLTRAALGTAIERVRASYWAVPAVLTVLALAAGMGAVAVDRWLVDEGVDATYPFVGGLDAEGARGLISIVAQSIFGVTGVMFSMTIVAVSFATGKYGPRLIGNFMRDRVNQWSLGVLTATFVFALVVMRSIRAADAEAAGFVPHASLIVALALTMACIGVVIYFVHHVPETIDISRITADIGRRLLDDIREAAEAQARAGAAPGGQAGWPERPPDHGLSIGRTGYVAAIDVERLRELALEADARIEVARGVGTFAGPETIALRIWGPGPGDDLRSRLLDCVVTGDTPTADRNLLHLLDQLVEITARALSPGVNDPFTAINCVHWIYAATLVAATHAGGLTDAQAGPVRMPPLSLDEILSRGFGASRAYTRGDALCDAEVRDMLGRLLAEVPPGAPRETIRRFSRGLDEQGAASARQRA